MKKSRRALAASFVVTVAALPSAGCKKTSVGDGTSGSGTETANVYRDSYSGACHYTTPEHCPKNATCNPPPPREVDCPPNLRDAAVDPPAITRRPPGKEDWLRMQGSIWSADATSCMVNHETFCAPPGKPISCTQNETQKVPCTKGTADAGQFVTSFQVASFVWKDVTGKCHKTEPADCISNKRCEIPEGEIVPCP